MNRFTLCRAAVVLALALLATALLTLTGCKPQGKPPIMIARYSLDDLDGIIDGAGLELDTEQSHDGHGSVRLTADGPVTIKLFEITGFAIENVRLVYQAAMRSEDLKGQAYLEMWCRFPEEGEFFSRALHDPLCDTTEWAIKSTPFFLQEGQNPELVRLNLVVDGVGTVWIDDLQLYTAPLE